MASTNVGVPGLSLHGDGRYMTLKDSYSNPTEIPSADASWVIWLKLRVQKKHYSAFNS